MAGLTVNVDIKQVWQICKKHMTKKECEEAFKELSDYIKECLEKAQGSQLATQVLGGD